MTDCQQCKELSDKFDLREGELNAALDALETLGPGASAQLWSDLRVAASEARLDFEIATLEREQHKLTHLRSQ